MCFTLIDKDELIAAIGVFIGIGLVSLAAKSLDDNMMLAPFGATSVIAFLGSSSKFAQPRNIVLGYILTSSAGIAVVYTLGNNWYDYAFGVALGLLAKCLFNAVHPPSAAMPIILIQANQSESISSIIHYVWSDVLPGLFILVITAIIYNRYILHRDYPLWRRKNE